MKKFSYILVLISFCICEAVGQIKITQMTTLDAKPATAFVPVVIGGINKKVRADSIASLAKTDTALIRKITHDSVASKANTSDVVNLTGNQTISGSKTFTGTQTFSTSVMHSNQVVFNGEVYMNDHLVLNTSPGAAGQVVTSNGPGTPPYWSTALPYKLYAAELTQIGTGDPTATVVINQLSGPIVWTRGSTGAYTGTLTAAFPVSKAYGLYSSLVNTDMQMRLYRFNDNFFFIEQRDYSNSSIDGFSVYIEIKVYN